MKYAITSSRRTTMTRDENGNVVVNVDRGAASSRVQMYTPEDPRMSGLRHWQKERARYKAMLEERSDKRDPKTGELLFNHADPDHRKRLKIKMDGAAHSLAIQAQILGVDVPNDE